LKRLLNTYLFGLLYTKPLQRNLLTYLLITVKV